MTETQKWKRRAEALFRIIDNIDSIDDIAKSDDPAYRKMVRDQVKKSRATVAADGNGQHVWVDPDDDSASLFG